MELLHMALDMALANSGLVLQQLLVWSSSAADGMILSTASYCWHHSELGFSLHYCLYLHTLCVHCVCTQLTCTSLSLLALFCSAASGTTLHAELQWLSNMHRSQLQ
jgi:hypothetical protein